MAPLRGDRLRVAHVLPAYAERGVNLMGGGERYAWNLARALSRRAEVTLVTFGPRAWRGQADGLPHLVLPALGGPPDNPYPRPSLGWLRGFDLVHAYQLRSAATSLLAVAARLRRLPLVVTDVGGGGRSLMYRARLHRLVPRFTLLSEFSRRLLPAEAARRAVVTPGGVDLERFAFASTERRRRVVQVGRIMPHKGINYLLEAAGEDLEVVIAGRVVDAAYHARLREQARGRKVAFVLDPDDRTVLDLYRTSAVTVAASVYRDLDGREWPNSELLGLTLLESMAVGTPVVSTEVGGMPEYVRDGETGYVVPPNDPAALRSALLRLLDDPARARAMGAAAARHVRQYSWAAVADRVLAVYGELASGAGRSL